MQSWGLNCGRAVGRSGLTSSELSQSSHASCVFAGLPVVELFCLLYSYSFCQPGLPPNHSRLEFCPHLPCVNVALRLAGCHQACISRLPFPYLCVFWNWCIADQLDPVISMKVFDDVVWRRRQVSTVTIWFVRIWVKDPMMWLLSQTNPSVRTLFSLRFTGQYVCAYFSHHPDKDLGSTGGLIQNATCWTSHLISYAGFSRFLMISASPLWFGNFHCTSFHFWEGHGSWGRMWHGSGSLVWVTVWWSMLMRSTLHLWAVNETCTRTFRKICCAHVLHKRCQATEISSWYGFLLLRFCVCAMQ